MENEYNNVSDFVDAAHELNLKETVISMGMLSKEDFKKLNFCSCIFHKGDNTPSLQVTENFFKCYACSSKGDLFKFIMLYYNIDFMEAVFKLADFLNVSIKNVKLTHNSKINDLLKEWTEYLENFENAPEDIKRLQKDYFPQEIGYDKKEEYLVLPLTSKTGAIYGFTKRRIDSKHKENGFAYIDKKTGELKFKTPKWKHSSLNDSLIGLCHNIFNLENANKSIKDNDKIVITEGPKDVIAYRRINIDFVVCTCGTGNSVNIWEYIEKPNEIILSFDGDSAGIHAFITNILYLAEFYDLNKVKCVVINNDKDPYDLIIENPKLLKDSFDNRISAIEYYIQFGTDEDILELYTKSAEFSKTLIIKTICNYKKMNLSEVNSWLSSINGNPDSSREIDEIKKLEATAKGELNLNPNTAADDVEKAKRILKLKYGINI